MVEAFYINGVFESVLEEIRLSQVERPQEHHFLQPYYYLPYTRLRDSPPTIEAPVTLYASITSDLHHVLYTAEIVDWEDKTAISPQRKDEVDSRIKATQPNEGGFNEGGRTPADRPSVNLLTVRNLQKLDRIFSVTELIKDSDGTPVRPRVQPGGFSYVHRRVVVPFVTELDVGDASNVATESGQFDPRDIEDARDRVATSIARRRGQPEFRRKLLAVYQGRCAITGYDAEQALEAAHIHPYRGRHTNHVQNGILLRADIHTLFDLGLVGIEPDTGEVIIRPELNGTQYAQLAGRKARMPQDVDERPSAESLRMHWQHARDNSW